MSFNRYYRTSHQRRRAGILGLGAVGGMLLAAMSLAAATAGTACADDLDIQISIDGIDLFPTAGNTATATSGMGDMAIAFGDGANAAATGGTFDFASASGTDSLASVTGSSPGATVTGNFDFASANGYGSEAVAGYGSFDYASAHGAGSSAAAFSGNGDTALASGTDSDAGASGTGPPFPIQGNDNFAAAFGPHTIAGAGSFVTGSTESNNDIALVFDPFGTVGSDAYAGSGLHDLAAVFADGLTANAFPGDDIVTILPML